ncbi:MAG: single-stranded-DNA-specific exonuclease RecJ [Proteobacteria bacterium]|nr:single-stranded-DNA-specific exonuclease RecJ [Pseudomonadota bacterium]
MLKVLIKRRPVPDSDVFKDSEIHPLVARLYLSRGIEQPDQVTYRLKNLLRPDALSGISQAANIIVKAIQQHKRIVVVGDFDADGATSTALVLRALKYFGAIHYDFMVPNRFDFGYGLSSELVDELVKLKAELLITVDNGISSINGVAKAKSLGMDVIITDHHLPGPKLPIADAIVNPNCEHDVFPSKNLAGVGVVFYLMAEVRAQLVSINWFEQKKLTVPVMARFLDLVALGTIADVVKLDANNRIMVSAGLKQISQGKTVVGIKAILQLAGRKTSDIDANTIAFVLAPRLNAAGRLEDMSIGINLLISDDMDEAMNLAQQLESINKQRKDIQQEMQRFADSVVKQLHHRDKLPAGICLFHKDWHQGVVGLLASKVKESVQRPVIAFARENAKSKKVKGSARSVEGFHIRDALVEIDALKPQLIAKFGGHAMAAGLSMQEADLDEFQQMFEHIVKQKLGEPDKERTVLTDGSIDPMDLSLNLAELIKRAGPWGQFFEPPLFDDWFIIKQKKEIGQGHSKLVLQTMDFSKQIDAVAFGVHPDKFAGVGQNTQVCYTPNVNEFRGRRSLQLIILHLIQ